MTAVQAKTEKDLSALIPYVFDRTFEGELRNMVSNVGNVW